MLILGEEESVNNKFWFFDIEGNLEIRQCTSLHFNNEDRSWAYYLDDLQKVLCLNDRTGGKQLQIL